MEDLFRTHAQNVAAAINASKQKKEDKNNFFWKATTTVATITAVVLAANLWCVKCAQQTPAES